MIDFKPLGDRAFLARFLFESEAQNWADAVRASAIPGVVDVAVAYSSAAVFVDPDRGDPVQVASRLQMVKPGKFRESLRRVVLVPVLYDGEDLAEVARLVDSTEPEVVERHVREEYRVFAIGFQPGFPYSGYLPEPLSGLPRLKSPRVRVPAGSVAIAGRQTGIYPRETPGGWRLLGRTPSKIVDMAQGFFPIRAGDRLRFEPIDEAEFQARLGEPIGLAE